MGGHGPPLRVFSIMSSSRGKPDTTSALGELSPRALELLTLVIFESHGWHCGISPPGPDGGVDIRARRPGLVDVVAAVQVKRYDRDRRIGPSTIREYAGLYQDNEPPDTVVIVASCGFTAAAMREAKERSVQLIDGQEVEHYYQVLEKAVPGPVTTHLRYLSNSPRTRSSSLPSLRPGPLPIVGAESVNNQHCHPNYWDKHGHGLSIIGSVLSQADISRPSDTGEAIQIRLVPSLNLPEWKSTTLRWEAAGRIQCENISAQGCANINALASRDRRLRLSSKNGTATLAVSAGSVDVIERLCSVFIPECLGARNQDLVSVIRTHSSGKPQKLYEALN